jgi:hypothetical protein
MMHSPDYPVAVATPRPSDRPPSALVRERTLPAEPNACLPCGHALQPNFNHCPNCGVNLSRQKTAEAKVDAVLQDLGLPHSRLRTALIVEVMGLTSEPRS